MATMTRNDVIKSRTACFSGHRPNALCGYWADGYKNARVQLTNLVLEMVMNNGIDTFVTGGAQGIDQLAFWAVEHAKVMRPDLKIKNVLVLPFPNFGANWKATGTFSRSELALAIGKADLVLHAHEDEPKDKQEAVRLLMARNDAMIELSGTMVAIYEDGNWSNPATRSGTAAAMRNATKTGLGLRRIGYSVRANVLTLEPENGTWLPAGSQAASEPDFFEKMQ